MKTNEEGVALIKDFEGCVLKAYPDPGTGGEPWTIGVGHTGGVKPGDRITEAQAMDMLRQDLVKFERYVTDALDGYPATANEFSAMVSLCFNIGPANFRKSSVLKNHKRGDKAAAAGAFKLWNKAAGKVLNGLTRRRAAEAALYMKPALVGKAVETRTTPDAEKPVVKSHTVIGTATVAVAGIGQQLVENLPAIQSAHTTVTQTGGFEWVTKLLGALIVLAAVYVLVRQWIRRRKGEG